MIVVDAIFMYNPHYNRMRVSRLNQTNINCIKCKHYFVTWDARFPRGCSLFGFKGAMMPSVTVLQATGAPCKNFVAKPQGPHGIKSV